MVRPLTKQQPSRVLPTFRSSVVFTKTRYHSRYVIKLVLLFADAIGTFPHVLGVWPCSELALWKKQRGINVWSYLLSPSTLEIQEPPKDLCEARCSVGLREVWSEPYDTVTLSAQVLIDLLAASGVCD